MPIDITPGAERVLALARAMALALQKEVEVLHTWNRRSSPRRRAAPR